MKTSILFFNLFIGVLSSFLFFSIASISNAYAAISDFNFPAVGIGDATLIQTQLLKE